MPKYQATSYIRLSYIGSYVIGRRAVIEVGGTRSRLKDRDKWFIITPLSICGTTTMCSGW